MQRKTPRPKIMLIEKFTFMFQKKMKLNVSINNQSCLTLLKGGTCRKSELCKITVILG